MPDIYIENDEDSEGLPPPKRYPIKLFFKGMGQFFRQLSLRARLVLAFVILIISSATATMFIGHRVFGQKVDEIARHRIEADIRVSEHVLQNRLKEFQIDAEALAMKAGMLDSSCQANAAFAATRPYQADRVIVLRETDPCFLSIIKGHDFSPLNLKPEATGDILEGPLHRFAQKVRETNSALVSVISLSPKQTRHLYPANPPEIDSLLLAAAVPFEPGGLLILLEKQDGHQRLMQSLNDLFFTLGNQEYHASLFAGSRRVDTTLPNSALGTEADPVVVENVLKKGEIYHGLALIEAVKAHYYTAYHPIRDFEGKIIGMIGIGTAENTYGEVRRRTTTLFSSLIAGGMIFGFIMAFLFSGWLTRPIKELAHGMDRVASGDLNYKLPAYSASELHRLARSFNLMVSAVKDRNIKLKEMTEMRLSTMEKQISIGRLAAGVAHEINNPLTAILTLSSLMLKKVPEGDPRRDDLKMIVDETTRCRDIVRSLLDFARERPAEKQVVDLNKVLSETLRLTAKYHPMGRLNVQTHFTQESLHVNADAKQLQQVFTNLILNAAEATPDGGMISVGTDEDSSGGFAVVRVSDTGKGISREHQKRIFEPFFTTKDTGKGTGLGLSVSLGIIQKHEGAIEIESEEGKGTTVTVILPLGWWLPDLYWQ